MYSGSRKDQACVDMEGLGKLHVKHSFTWWISCETLPTCYAMAV